VARARAETPGCERLIHFDNAGAALQPTVVRDTVARHLQREADLGGYAAADAASDAIEGVYGAAARLLGCSAAEIAVVENATRAWDMVFYAVDWRPGDRILTGRAEYASNVIAMLQVARRHEVEVVVVDDDGHGQVDVAALEAALDDRVRMIAITHVPTSGGLVNPAEAIGALARDSGVLFLLDACQSAGQLALDVDELRCDALTATGRKFLRGPRGTGLLYVRDRWIEQLEPPLLDLHAATWTSPTTYVIRDDARRFENWECNVAAKLGLGAAIEYALGWGVEAIAERVSGLAGRLRAQLGEVRGVDVHDRGERQCGIVTFTVDGAPAADVEAHLRRAGVNTSVSRRESAQLDLPARGLSEVVRASPHYYNTEEEIDRFAVHIRSVAGVA
jgi:cysteine desulfurase/selenocysteine lyase